MPFAPQTSFVPPGGNINMSTSGSIIPSPDSPYGRTGPFIPPARNGEEGGQRPPVQTQPPAVAMNTIQPAYNPPPYTPPRNPTQPQYPTGSPQAGGYGNSGPFVPPSGPRTDGQRPAASQVPISGGSGPFIPPDRTNQPQPNRSAFTNANQNARFMRGGSPQPGVGQNSLASLMAGGQGQDPRMAASQWIQTLSQRNPQALQRLLSMFGNRGGGPMGGGSFAAGPAAQSPVGMRAPLPQPQTFPFPQPQTPNLYSLAVPMGGR